MGIISAHICSRNFCRYCWMMKFS
uniref:Uncharacterized protein n=1 Tax=Rhizophora mucronata TaxID=61149 RepID=A0A2P2ISR6_RHIMU